MEDVRRGDSARELAVDVDVGRIEDVLDSRHRRDRHAALVDGLGGDVRVSVDDARHHELSGGVDDLGVRGDRRRSSPRRRSFRRESRTVPFSIVPLVTVRIVPPRIATVSAPAVTAAARTSRLARIMPRHSSPPLTSNFFPSTNTVSIFVPSSNTSPCRDEEVRDLPRLEASRADPRDRRSRRHRA